MKVDVIEHVNVDTWAISRPVSPSSKPRSFRSPMVPLSRALRDVGRIEADRRY
jgi:hypothetical protein